jgi:pimeloyl-ACP methyl ester carboxylesterase
MRSKLPVLFALLLLIGLSPAAQDVPVGTLTPSECPMGIPTGAVVDCAYLTVPADHTDPANPQTYELAVAILRAENVNPKPDPVLYLEGGPGGSGVLSLQGWIGQPIVADRDLILLDQRGTGHSDPWVSCEVYEYSVSVEEDIERYYGMCARNLRADGIEPSTFTTAQTAADVAMLVRALGYETMNLYSISYGTRVALTVMRDHPEVVRAVVLDSPFPPHVDGLEEQAVNGWNAMKAMMDDCAADSVCSEAFPDLEARLTDYLITLDDEPLTFDFGDGEYDYVSSDIISLVFDLMYDSTALPYLPLALHDLTEDFPDTLAWLNGVNYDEDDEEYSDEYDYYDGYDRSDSDTYYTVNCAEEIPFESYGDAVALAEATGMPQVFADGMLSWAQSEFLACKSWGITPTGSIETELVVSDLPTLVLVGEYDPITPPVWGTEAMRGLSNGQLVEAPAGGHSVVDYDPCMASLGVAFFDAPGQPLDLSCTRDQRVRFEVE